MKRLRLLFSIASLFAFAITGEFYLIGYQESCAMEIVEWRGTSYRVFTYQGSVGFSSMRQYNDAPQLSYPEMRKWLSPREIGMARPTFGFFFPHGLTWHGGLSATGMSVRRIWEFRFIGIPCWLVMFLLAILPVQSAKATLRKSRERKRLATGLCIQCGYDLRASAERCPECGNSTPTAAVIATT